MTAGTRTLVHRWVRRAFVVWAIGSTSWVANTMRTRGVPGGMLQTSPAVNVTQTAATLEFMPASREERSGLVFLCGGGVSARAYAPLLRPVAQEGFPVFVIRLPYRLAPLESHKVAAVVRAREVMAAHPEIDRWVIAGHSLGAALATRLVESDPGAAAALVLIGTTHPRERNLSSLTIPVTKVWGSNDGVAPPERMFANRSLLPPQTRWVEIRGGNHSQFGHYGHQLLDGKAAVNREEQQAQTRDAILESLRSASVRP